MQAKDGQFHEVKPAGIYDYLREASAPNAAETETPRVTAPPLAPARGASTQRLSKRHAKRAIQR